MFCFSYPTYHINNNRKKPLTVVGQIDHISGVDLARGPHFGDPCVRQSGAVAATMPWLDSGLLGEFEVKLFRSIFKGLR